MRAACPSLVSRDLASKQLQMPASKELVTERNADRRDDLLVVPRELRLGRHDRESCRRPYEEAAVGHELVTAGDGDAIQRLQLDRIGLHVDHGSDGRKTVTDVDHA